MRAHLSAGTEDHHLVVISNNNVIGRGWVGKTFKSLVTEPGVTGGGSDKEGEALELQEMREAGLQARSEGIFCGLNLDRL